MFNTTSKTCIALGVALCLSACSTTDQNKSQIGAVIGGVLGAVAGAVVAKNNKAAGAAIGAAIGAGAGYMIGQSLDERDQAALKAKIEEAAARDATRGQTVWQSDHSGASATITPVEAPRRLVVTKSIATDPDVVIEKSPLVFATGQRQATADVNVRLGPGTQYPVKVALHQGQIIQVIGMANEGWYVMAEGNTAVGYVSGRYLQRPGGRRESSIRQATGPIETTPQAPRREVEAAPHQAKRTHEVDVRIARTCRPVHVRVRTADGKVTEETVTTCQNPEGSWGA